VLLSALVGANACGSREGTDNTDSGVVIVNAPAAGEVRRVLAKEGMQLKKGEAVVEIVVRAEGAAAPTPRGEDPVAAAGRNIASAQAEVEAARAEVVAAPDDPRAVARWRAACDRKVDVLRAAVESRL
jgi:multidrug efflux pump subunit AcrA (membrane-fusion protein)